MILSSSFNILLLPPLLFGIMFGFLLVAFLTIGIIQIVVKKKNPLVRNASVISYNKAKKQKTWSKKIAVGIGSEIDEVAKSIRIDSKHPLFELSINEAIEGLTIVHKKLDKIVENPLMYDAKKLTVANILKINEVIVQPSRKIINNKVVKILYKIWIVICYIINLINPVSWIKRLMNWTIFKNGKKDLWLLALDYLGYNFYSIYSQNFTKDKTVKKKKKDA